MRNAAASGRRRAIVLGASMGGICAARALAKHFDEVVVLDRDEIPETPDDRRGVPQARHYHTMLGLGQRTLEGWFPGLGDALLADGAVRVNHGRDGYAFVGGAPRIRCESSFDVPTCSRTLLEHHVRRRIASMPGVSIRPRTTAVGLSKQGGRITGVKVEGDALLEADLIVDATGRASRAVRWLPELGFETPEAEEVTVHVGYASRVVRRVENERRDFRLAMVGTDPPQRLGVASPMEGSRWIVTLVGYHGDHPPADEQGFFDFARSLPSPVVADVLAESEPLSDIVAHRMPSSQWRRVDRMKQIPDGFLLFGDSICSLNPVYGQGMTSAVLQSDALEATLGGVSGTDAAFVQAFYRRAAKPIAMLWQMATGGDLTLPQTKGPKGASGSNFATRLLSAYMRRVMGAGQVSEMVASRTLEITHLLRSPAGLVSPGMVWEVLAASRRARPAAPRASGGQAG
ncbi:hypothetical protein QHF84_00410 [Polyangium sp. y55x31]|nr:hypothetical protein [Polyangium sp. y55x31]